MEDVECKYCGEKFEVAHKEGKCEAEALPELCKYCDGYARYEEYRKHVYELFKNAGTFL